jgi:hypothetical protein
MSCFRRCADPIQNETRNHYSHHCGDALIHFVSLCSRAAFKGRIPQGKGEQEIE